MKSIYVLALGISSLSVQAQTNVDLNTVSVTANRLQQSNKESGRSITIVEGRAFHDLPVHTVDELLRYVPGVEVQSRGPMGAQSDIVIRGGTFQQVLILLDGVKLNDPITGHFNANLPVAAYEIERIEILRGPAAAIYGAEAVGGVVNIITKNFNHYDTTKQSQGQIKLIGGEYNLYGTDAGLRITGKKVNATIGLLSNNTSGQLLRANSRGYVYQNSIGAAFRFRLANNWSLSWRTSYDNRDFAAQNFYTTFASDNATEKVTVLWNQLQLRQQKANGSQQIDAAYKHSTDYYKFSPTISPNENTADLAMIQYINHHHYAHGLSSSVGGQLSQRGIRSNDRGNHLTAQAALFASAIYKLNHWRLSGALRGEYDQNYGFALLPQASLCYVMPQMTLRAHAGRAIRSADFTERYNNYNKAEVKSGSIGNPDLIAEQSWSYELGAMISLGKSMSINTAAFLRQQDNLIDWVNTPFVLMPRKENLVATGNYSLAKNIKDLRTTGAELELLFSKKFDQQHQLQASSGLTYLHSVSTDPNPSFYILAHAKWLLQSTITYHYNKLMLGVNMMYKERKPFSAPAIDASVSSSYCLVNAQFAYTWSKSWSASLRCNNIGDVQYSDLLGSKMPARWWSATIMYRF